MRRYVVPVSIGLAAGILGVLLALLGRHLYQDHLYVDAIRQFNLQQLQRAQTGNNK